MSNQAAAGWYPDAQGNVRYWDGTTWTEHVRTPEAARPEDAPTSKDGAFSKLGSAVKKAAAERKAVKEEQSRQQAEHAQAAGDLVTSGVFGTSTVEIYQNGYVRIASHGEGANSSAPKAIDKHTPYEKLRSIKFSQPEAEKSGRGTSSLESTVGPAVAGILKGGKHLVKGSAPGLAMAGIAHFASNEARKTFLTIATDKQIHTLTNQRHNGVMNTSNKSHNDVGVALEAAGNAVLGIDPARHTFAAEAQPQTTAADATAAGPTLSGRLRELAELHKEGILSDEEFTASKAKLLGSI